MGSAVAKLSIPTIIGGTHASYFAADCLKHIDYVVLGEGDEIILNLIDAISTNGDLSKINGIAYLQARKIRINQPQYGLKHFNTIPDYSLIDGYKPMTWFDIIRKGRLPLVTVQSSRGCPFHCSYCIVDTMFPGGYRNRNIESVISDLKDKRKYGKELLFVDNNFAANIKYSKRLLQRLIEEDLNYDIMALTRADVAKNEELLTLMRKAGITQLYQGYESVESTTLKEYKKRQTISDVKKSIKKLYDFGFQISGSFVLGADTDTLETIDSTIQFVKNAQLTISYFFPIWGHYIEPKSGCKSIVPRHRAIFKGWKYCDGNFVTHFPMKMRPSQLQTAIIQAHRKVFSFKEIKGEIRNKKYRSAMEKATHLWMWNTIQKNLIEYIPWLEKIEDGLYDQNNHLLKDSLLERYAANPEWKFPADADAPHQVDNKESNILKSRCKNASCLKSNQMSHEKEAAVLN